jgi:hypothetical protein
MPLRTWTLPRTGDARTGTDVGSTGDADAGIADADAKEGEAGIGAPFDYYISTSGSDSNPGTLASPWAITSLQVTNSNFSRFDGVGIGCIAIPRWHLGYTKLHWKL